MLLPHDFDSFSAVFACLSLQLDTNNEAWNAWQGINRWVGLHLDFVGAVVLLSVALMLATLRESFAPGMVWVAGMLFSSTPFLVQIQTLAQYLVTLSRVS